MASEYRPHVYSSLNWEVAFNPPSIENHPLLKVLKQGKIVADQATAVEKSKLLPQLQLGYNLNSFKGVGPDNRTYDATPRFHSVQVGLAIPRIFQRTKGPGRGIAPGRSNSRR